MRTAPRVVSLRLRAGILGYADVVFGKSLAPDVALFTGVRTPPPNAARTVRLFRVADNSGMVLPCGTWAFELSR